ncbi:glycoside hydrolase family 5 protein [Schizophyllum commune Loenen D]|nr:glycoside hydrolase family 5 protein [Schizophyllum commune Loenen D]
MPRSLLSLTVLGLSLFTRSLALQKRQWDTQDKIHGVNLGGWLVLEPWITPSLFEATGNDKIIDEWTFGELQDRDAATAALKAHWDSWITEDDFRQIAEAGLTHVRLPIGYWAFETGPGEPYINGQIPYLQKALDWAAKYGLKVNVDLHGAPGSQNGFDNSGQKMTKPGWAYNETNVARTEAVLQTMTELVKDSEAASIIAPLNEIAPWTSPDMIMDVAKGYWQDSYDIVSKTAPQKTVMIHDVFNTSNYWADYWSDKPHGSAMIDTHFYQVFVVDQLKWNFRQHIEHVCERASNVTATSLPTVVGEWTLALTDCAKYLNGLGVGARWDGTYPDTHRLGSCDKWTGAGDKFDDKYREQLRAFRDAQVRTWLQGQGYFFWTWKAEEAAEWSYQDGLKYGWIPKDPNEMKYPDICSDPGSILSIGLDLDLDISVGL